MSINRVTGQSSWQSVHQSMNAAALRMDAASAQAASGRSFQHLRDAPTVASTVMRIDEQTSQLDAYARQATDATSWLETANNGLMDASATISEALGLVKAATNGSLSPSARGSLADQLDAMSAALFETAGQTHLGKSIFGGFGDTAVSRDASGTVTYSGVPGQVLRQLTPTETVAVNVDGAKTFGFASGDDVFKVLKDASAAARAGDKTALASTFDRLTARHADVLGSLETVGLTQRRVDSTSSSNSAAKLRLASSRSDLADVDVAKSVMDMQLAQDGYQAVLAVATRAAQMPSLAQLLH